MSENKGTPLEASDQERFKELLRRTGEFIAYFEIAEGKMITWKNDIESSFSEHKVHVKTQLESIKVQCDAMNETMTEVGAARWRIAAESALSEGQQHLNELKTVCNQHIKQCQTQQVQLSQIAKNNLSEIKKAETLITAKINNVIKRLNLEEIRELAEHSRDLIEESAHTAVNQHQKLLKQFRLKTISLVFAVVMLTSAGMGLYLNDEMPWEIHKHAKQERMAGKALIHAWPGLTQDIKDKLISSNQ